MSKKISNIIISAFIMLPVWLTTGCGGGDSEAKIQSKIISSEATHIELTVSDGLNPDPSQRINIYKRAISDLGLSSRDVLYGLKTTNNDLHCSEDGTQYAMTIISPSSTQIYTSNNNWCNREPAPTGHIAAESLSALVSALKSE